MSRVWITRAQPGADRTAARLMALGLVPVVQPLLQIQPIPQAAPDLTGIDALAFTSINGVAAFAALTVQRDRPILAVGDATAQAARAAGFTDVISASGDLADLAQFIQTRMPGGTLMVPGALEPAGDLSARLPGLTVRSLPVYRAVETGAEAPPNVEVALIHSPRAGRALAALKDSLPPGLRVVAISAKASEPVSGIAPCAVAGQPNEASLLNALVLTLGNRPPPV